MHIKNIRCIEEKLAECIKCEFDKGIENINTEEMGQVTDMLKDVTMAEYYARIGVAMQKAEEEDEEVEKYMQKRFVEEYGEDDGRRYYDHWRYKNGRFAPKGRGSRRGYEEYPYYHMTPEMYHDHDPEYYRDMDRDMGRMYYTSKGTMPRPGRMEKANSTAAGRRYYDGDYERDEREGRSGMSRRSYMETKEMHNDNSPESKQAKMKDLEKYMSDLGADMADLIKDMSPEERTLAKTKLTTLVQKM